MAIVQSGVGPIELLDHFCGGGQHLVAETTVPPLPIGNGTFHLVGQGIADTDSGAEFLEADGVGGVMVFTATNEAEHAIGTATPIMFDVGLCGPIVAECRIRFPTNLVTREFFFGFSDVATDLAILEGAIAHGVTTTFTLTASDILGFWLSSELTATAEWHAIHNGGTATGVTDSTLLDLDVNAVAGDYNILRLEIDPNGTARWYIDGNLVKTLASAVSTSVDLNLLMIVEEKVTGNAAFHADYEMARFNPDYTV
jgi:hypothetical protein